jgi:hypothetical protein
MGSREHLGSQWVAAARGEVARTRAGVVFLGGAWPGGMSTMVIGVVRLAYTRYAYGHPQRI